MRDQTKTQSAFRKSGPGFPSECATKQELTAHSGKPGPFIPSIDPPDRLTLQDGLHSWKHSKNLFVQSVEHRQHRSFVVWFVVDKIANAPLKRILRDATDLQTEHLQGAPDLILNIQTLASS